MAFGLPVEGDDGPFAGEAVTEVPTCAVDANAADGLALLDDAGVDVAIVVSAEGLAIGAVDRKGLSAADGGAPLLDVMAVVPDTVRPSTTVGSLSSGHTLVTTSDGRLLGEVVAEEHEHDRDQGDLGQRMERELGEVLAAVSERFGDREPSEEELRSFLRDRLVAEGRSPEEADEFLAAMGEDDGG
jgi:CBS domain-containing protein